MSDAEQDHQELRESLGAFALGRLSGDEEAAVAAHLDRCADCRADLADIAPAAAALADLAGGAGAGPAAPPPAALWAGIESRIAREQAPGHAPARAACHRAPRWVAPVTVAAALTGVLGGVVGYALAPEPARAPFEVVAVQALEPGIEASAGLIPHTWGVEVRLQATGFDAGSAYKVAVLGRDSKRVGAGAFVGTGAREMVCNLNSSLLRPDATGFEVTDAAGDVVLRSSFAS